MGKVVKNISKETKSLEQAVDRLADLNLKMEELKAEADFLKKVLQSKIDVGSSVLISQYRVSNYESTSFSFSKTKLVKKYGKEVLRFATKYTSKRIQLKKVEQE